MSRNGSGIFIVRRPLDGRKLMYVHIPGHNGNTARMLPCRAPHAGTAADKTIDMRITRILTPIIKIVLHKAVGSLVRHRGNGAGAKHIVFTKKLLGILMSYWLIISGKIQVNIRNLVAVKAHENSKRNILSVFAQALAALRAIFIRQVKAAPVAAVGKKFAVQAVFTTPMRRQGVYLRNAAHGRYKGRAY